MTGCTLLHFALLVPAALASQAVRELPGIVNYMRGDDRRLWVSGVPLGSHQLTVQR